MPPIALCGAWPKEIRVPADATIPIPLTAGELMIEVVDLHKAFGGHVVLDGISFNVHHGETLCILGRSGTGKSVLLKTIIALLDPDQGQVTVLGRNLHHLPERERLRARKDLGYVFQGAALFDSLTVCENVGFSLYQQHRPAPEIRARVVESLTAVGLAHAIDKLPSQLSGGMQKRVGLARAIISRPRVVLYDEPTTGLDPLTTDTINDIILSLQRSHGITSIVVTHDVRSALTIGTRLILLEQGKIVASGTPDEMRANPDPLVRRFLGLD
jgi:phospholipid/cholesterol/gamma-HCH transport system ATP-binding protein